MRRTGVWVSVFRNSIIHQFFSDFLQPLRDFRTCSTRVGKQRVSPFYHGLLFICFWEFLIGMGLLVISFTANNGFHRSIINIGTWHKHRRGISFTLILSFSSLTVTWCCCSWWRRRAGRRFGTMPLLFWRCHWSWRMRTGGRTLWQAWNQDKNEVLRVALYPNPVFNEMGFLTIDTFVGIPVSSQSFPSDNTAGVFSRTFTVKKISNSLTYTIASSCVCTSPLAVMTIVGLHDFVKVSISALFKSFLLIMCFDALESTTNSRSSSLRVDAGKHPFPKVRRILLFHAPLIFNTLLASFHAASRAACSCHSVSSWDRSSNFGALGLRSWSSPGQIFPSEGFWSRILVWRAIAFVNFTRWIGFRISVLFRRMDFGGVMSWNTQPNCRASDNRRWDDFCPNFLSLLLSGFPDRSWHWSEKGSRSCQSSFFSKATALLSSFFLDLFVGCSSTWRCAYEHFSAHRQQLLAL